MPAACFHPNLTSIRTSENYMQRRNILKALSAVIAGAAIVTSFGAHADDKVIKVGT